jgi:hypothetical protein
MAALRGGPQSTIPAPFLRRTITLDSGPKSARLYSVTQGATTIWERWDGWTRENGFQDAGINSFNHYAYGSIGAWLYSAIAGINIDPKQPGYKHIILRPFPDERLLGLSAGIVKGRSWYFRFQAVRNCDMTTRRQIEHAVIDLHCGFGLWSRLFHLALQFCCFPASRLDRRQIQWYAPLPR